MAFIKMKSSSKVVDQNMEPSGGGGVLLTGLGCTWAYGVFCSSNWFGLYLGLWSLLELWRRLATGRMMRWVGLGGGVDLGGIGSSRFMAVQLARGSLTCLLAGGDCLLLHLHACCSSAITLHLYTIMCIHFLYVLGSVFKQFF